MPTGAQNVLGDLADGRAQLALGADRVAAVNLVAPAAQSARDAARNPSALEIARGAAAVGRETSGRRSLPRCKLPPTLRAGNLGARAEFFDASRFSESRGVFFSPLCQRRIGRT
jgi:hypothetical protein